MKLLNANEKNSFDPTPKLKSSPLPISFISFNNYDKNCFSCGDEYTILKVNYLMLRQEYCKKCLLRYINKVTDINTYLDVTMKTECELTPRNIHEIFYFEQIYYDYYRNWYTKLNACKLCGKLRRNSNGYIKPCSDCYRISYERIESTITKKFISILHLPCWYSDVDCIACESIVKSTSDREKICYNCYIIYSGCRYCLTTNVIFGFTDQSQCMKCKRVSFIDITKISSGNSDLDNFLYDINSNIQNFHNKLDEQIANLTGNDNSILNIIDYIKNAYRQNQPDNSQMKWIPYSEITNMEKIAEGGFGIIYKATWRDATVVVKRVKNSQNISKYFLNELKSNHYCYKLDHHIIQTFGFTKDPESEDYMLVMEYASEGDLHKYLQRNFTQISWDKEQNLQKLRILWQISDGLQTIHKANFIHRDFHSGNILFNGKINIKYQQYKIGDLGLSQSASSASSNNEIYGVIPYVAPEIFNGSAFSKESDIYCFGMIMWELTTGCKPFANVEHDEYLILRIFNGERPKITKDTPECFANLMKSCWHSNPKKRPTIEEIRKNLRSWNFNTKDNNQFNQAEVKRKKLINSKKLGPEFTERPHQNAIFTSRPLSSLISKASSIRFLSSSLKYNSKEYEFDINNRMYNKGYISREYEFDIDVTDTQSSSSPNLNSTTENFATTQHPEAIYTSRPTNEFNLSTTSRKC